MTIQDNTGRDSQSYGRRQLSTEECFDTYERIAPPEEVILSWIWEAPDPLADIPMRVLFHFVEKDDATEVVITHERLPSDTACTIHADGWEAALDSLARYMLEPSR